MEVQKNKEQWLARRVAELGHSQDYANELEVAQAQLLGKTRALDRELASFRESVSWKLTAPLRRIQNLIFGRKEMASALDQPWASSPTRPEFSADALPLSRHSRRIGVDVSSLCASDAGGGVQRVVRQIAQQLAGTSTADEIVLLDLRRGWPADATFRFLKNPETEARAGTPCFEFHTLLLLDASWRFLDSIRPILHAARSAGIEVVSCVYDLIPVDFPETCQPGNKEIYLRWLPEAIALSDSFVCISKAVADRFARYLIDEKIPEKKRIGWWSLGCDFSLTEARPLARLVAEKYVLMVGTLEPRKRHDLALDAFEMGWKSGQLKEALVIAGRAGWGMDAFQERMKNHPEWQKRVFWFPDMSDLELIGLYTHASVLLQASCAEGFGLPVAEGAKFGKPVVLSDLPVFHEIVRSEGYFFESGNPQALMNAVIGALRPEAKPTEVIQTTWAQSAEELKTLVQAGAYPLSHP